MASTTAAGNSTIAATTSTSTSPLPDITTNDPRPDIAEQIKMTVDDLVVAGDLLGVVVMISIIMNIYTIFVVSKNWKNFVQFPFSQSNIICMFLSFADLLLGLLLGLPTAIHMRFADYFSEQHPKVMVHYSRVAGYFLLDYMFLFRSIIIAIICIDRCVHILRPLGYKIWVSNRLTIGIIAGMTIFPLLARVAPQIIFLNVGGQMISHISCSSFRNPDPDEGAVISTFDSINFTLPLSCSINIWLDGVKTGLGADKTKASWPGRVAVAEVVLYTCSVVFTFLSIVIGNIIILVVIIRRFRARQALTCHTNQDPNVMKSKVKQSIQKNLMATSIMALVFLISNGPFVVIGVVDYMVNFLVKLDIGIAWRTGDDKMRLYLTMCMFLSLLVNPWLYPLRMETIRKFFPCLKRPLSTTLRDTRTQIFSTAQSFGRTMTYSRTISKAELSEDGKEDQPV
ncbi:uncharacterized protein LOC134813716 isoform X2 [Bolinopsis microptera]|uniref:uncharacterized protein LOC134813716 isoform X2 n=1 Tax=Bolinopsis microptera TaxID=2820187 RepID=UPI00307AB496